MPNWCSNRILIEGDDVVIDQIMEIAGDPPNLMNLRAKPDDVEDWYQWRLANWGTKWELDVNSWDVTDHSILIDASSAWSPPIALLEYISEMFSCRIGASYYEFGCDFVGAVRIDNGVLTESSGSISDSVEADEDAEDYFEQVNDVCERLVLHHVEAVLAGTEEV